MLHFFYRLKGVPLNIFLPARHFPCKNVSGSGYFGVTLRFRSHPSGWGTGSFLAALPIPHAKLAANNKAVQSLNYFIFASFRKHLFPKFSNRIRIKSGKFEIGFVVWDMKI